MTSLTNAPLNTVVPQCMNDRSYEDFLYLTTCEKKQKHTLRKLAEAQIVGNTMLGVSGFFLLNAVAIRGSLSKGSASTNIEHIVAFDNSAIVENFWFDVQIIMNQTGDRENVLKRVCDLIIAKAKKFFPLDSEKSLKDIECIDLAVYSIEQLLREVEKGKSWLSDDGKFKRIAEIFRKKNFHFLRLNIFDPLSFQILFRELTKREMSPDTIYSSNIFETARSLDERKRFLASIDQIRQTPTLIVDAITKPISVKVNGLIPLTQRVRRQASTLIVPSSLTLHSKKTPPDSSTTKQESDSKNN